MAEEQKPKKNNNNVTDPDSSKSIIRRRSRWASSLAALRYIASSADQVDVKMRDSDRATSIWLLIVTICACLSLFMPYFSFPNEPHALIVFCQWFSAQRFPLIMAADVLWGCGLAVYVANRFGSITTMTPRQALFCWQLMLGSCLIGMFLVINLALISFLSVESRHIVISQPHPNPTIKP